MASSGNTARSAPAASACVERGEDALDVAVEVADDGVELAERDAHAGHDLSVRDATLAPSGRSPALIPWRGDVPDDARRRLERSADPSPVAVALERLDSRPARRWPTRLEAGPGALADAVVAVARRQPLAHRALVVRRPEPRSTCSPTSTRDCRLDASTTRRSCARWKRAASSSASRPATSRAATARDRRRVDLGRWPTTCSPRPRS